MKTNHLCRRALIAGILATAALAVCANLSWAAAAAAPAPAAADSRDNASPWGIGAGPGDNLLPATGANWVRAFEEWQHVERSRNQWNWGTTDKLVAAAKANNIHILGWWWYFSPFASADGGTRKGPIKNMDFWREYVAASIGRYQKDIKYWEVWNEFNGSFYDGRQGADRIKDYADLTVAAYDAAKKVDPTSKIGMSVASSDIAFIGEAIKDGAAGHFDFICLHPYENLSTVMNGGDDVGFLTLGQITRRMLATYKQPVNTPLWVTEIGEQAPGKPDAVRDARQADAFAKAYIYLLAQDFQRVIWFGFRPWTDAGGDFGLIRADGSKRPSYAALTTMTRLLGQEPKYLGWLDLGKGGFGFVFQGKDGPVLAATCPIGTQFKTTFAAEVRVTDLSGKESPLAAGAELAITPSMVFVAGLPADLAQQAKGNHDKPFPWGGDYAAAKSVSCKLGEKNIDEGVRQIILREDNKNRSVAATADGQPCRRVTGKDGDSMCFMFRVDPQFAPYDLKTMDITVVAKRVVADQQAELAITYETPLGHKDFKKGGEKWVIPAGDGWQEHTWHVTDACFANKWGWHIGLIPTGTTKEFLIKEIRVSKSGSSDK